MTLGRFHNLQTRSAPRLARGEQNEGVDPCPVADAARARASITEMQRDAIIRLARQNPNRRARGAATEFEFDNLFVGELKPPRRGGRNKRGVVPREFCKWFRQFLKPCVVGKTSVMNVRIESQKKFKISS